MKSLKDKVSLITGGSSGIGLATARRFFEEGAQTIITGRNENDLKQAADSISSHVTYIACDVSKAAELDHLYSVIQEKFGRIDVLVANAAVGVVGQFGSVTEEHFDLQFDINVRGLFFTVQKALPLLPDGSSIILTSSAGSRKGGAAYSVYSASKAAVRSFARSWTVDLKDRKIRVNSLSPGPTETPIFEKAGFDKMQVEQILSQLASQVPLARVARPEEIASAILFLASDESSYITGVDLCVDGGWAQI